jgi:serine/threonine protein kinase
MSDENNLFGGEAIAAGGFGCVFRPALKCEGVTTRTSGVSKLMLKRYAEEEYNEIQRILPIIEEIPNNENYFIAKGVSKCKPDALTDSDLKNFDKKCSNLIRRFINENTVNVPENLVKLNILNTIDGGVDVAHYISNPGFNIDRFNTMNESLLKLLKFGIIPMNEKGLYHMDVKGNNILIGSDNNARLIDWGLAKSQRDINDVFARNRPIQFNLPFGIVLFQSQMLNIIQDAASLYAMDTSPSKKPFSDFLKSKYAKKMEKKVFIGNGHYGAIKEDYQNHISHNKSGSNIPFNKMFSDHIIKIVSEYTKNGKEYFIDKNYLNNIFK